MKFRKDFVTNSSSSSFVVGLKAGTTRQQVVDFVKETLAELDLEGTCWEDMGCDPEELPVEDIVRILYDWPMKYGQKLWHGDIAFACTVSNEDGGGGAVLYDYAAAFNGDHVVTGTFN